MKKLSLKIWLCVLGFHLVLVAGCGTRTAKMSRIEAARDRVFDTLADVGENQIGVVPVRLHLDPSGPPPSPRELEQIGRIRAFSRYSDAELIETIGAMKDPLSRFTAIRLASGRDSPAFARFIETQVRASMKSRNKTVIRFAVAALADLGFAGGCSDPEIRQGLIDIVLEGNTRTWGQGFDHLSEGERGSAEVDAVRRALLGLGGSGWNGFLSFARYLIDHEHQLGRPTVAVSGALIDALAMHEKTILIGVDAAKMHHFIESESFDVPVLLDLVVGEEYRELDGVIRERRGFLSRAETEAMRLR